VPGTGRRGGGRSPRDPGCADRGSGAEPARRAGRRCRWRQATLDPAGRAGGAGGFPAEIWTKIAVGASEMFPSADASLPVRDRVAPGAEPRLAWIEAAAIAL